MWKVGFRIPQMLQPVGCPKGSRGWRKHCFSPDCCCSNRKGEASLFTNHATIDLPGSTRDLSSIARARSCLAKRAAALPWAGEWDARCVPRRKMNQGFPCQHNHVGDHSRDNSTGEGRSWWSTGRRAQRKCTAEYEGVGRTGAVSCGLILPRFR